MVFDFINRDEEVAYGLATNFAWRFAMSIAPMPPVTLDEFLRLEAEAPEGVTLELIEGKLVERPSMTTRGRLQAFVMSLLVYELVRWSQSFHQKPVEIGSGEARCRLTMENDTIVGVDTGVWIGEQYASPSNDPLLYEGPPVVAAEILSPSDKNEYVDEKIAAYLAAGVHQVWILDPMWRTVTVYHPDSKPAFYAEDDVLNAAPDLTGFSLPVSQFFSKYVKRPV